MGVLSRWQAAGAHFLICLAVAVGVIALMLGLWYPPPLFAAAGGHGLLVILLVVDVVLGPLLTLVVFKAGKRGLKLDLFLIGLVQVLALGYGLHVVALARPAFIVFVADRFDLVAAADLDPDDLAAAKYPEFRTAPWTGPRLAAAVMPADPRQRAKIMNAMYAGRDMQHFPELFVPYADMRQAVLAKAATIARLRSEMPASASAIDGYLASSGAREADLRALLLRTRFAWLVVLVNAKTAQPVKMLLGERIE